MADELSKQAGWRRLQVLGDSMIICQTCATIGEAFQTMTARQLSEKFNELNREPTA
jgi:hypothetical protein